jgi:hypothetical protein
MTIQRVVRASSGKWYRKTLSFGRTVGLHVAVAERALGKPLPRGAVVHHIDGDIQNNAPHNLVVCEDRAYHNLIHRRERAMQATGNPDALLCQVCGSYRDQHIMRDYANGPQRFRIHADCLAERNRHFKQLRKERREAA